MFREKNDQGSSFTALTLLPEEERRRLEKTWAWAFRTKALPLVAETAFSHPYDWGNGRPNFPVQTLIGLLVIKEMFDPADDETLFNLGTQLAYQVVLTLDPGEVHTCQKMLHNIRRRFIACDADKLQFQTVTDKMLKALGVEVSKQRVDSTHIPCWQSNVRSRSRPEAAEMRMRTSRSRVFLSRRRSRNASRAAVLSVLRHPAP